MNAKKTKAVQVYNQDPSQTLTSISKADFVYLGAWVDSSVRDIKIRRAIHGQPVTR